MHPYRDPPTPSLEEPQPNEEVVLYGALVAIGGIPVVVAGLGGTAFGFDATLGSLMAIAGAVGLVRWRRYGRSRS